MLGPKKHSEEPLTNRAFIGAYRKGQTAFKEGKPISDCPYRDTRGGKYLHVITYSRAFINCWEEGHRDAEAGVCKY